MVQHMLCEFHLGELTVGNPMCNKKEIMRDVDSTSVHENKTHDVFYSASTTTFRVCSSIKTSISLSHKIRKYQTEELINIFMYKIMIL